MSYFLRLSAVTLLGTVLESSSPSSKVYAHDVSAMERGTTMRGTLYVHSVMLPMLFNLHIHGGGTRQFGRLYPYIHGAAKIPWGGNLPMVRSVKFYLPQNRAIFSYRPMRDSPPHGTSI